MSDMLEGYNVPLQGEEILMTPQVALKQRPTENAEKNGYQYEELVWTRFRQMGCRVFEKTHVMCKIPMAESLRSCGLGIRQEADAYLPDFQTYVEIKSGAGIATDSIDRKFLGDLVLFEHGYYGLDTQIVLCDRPSHVLYVFAGMKEHSAYVKVFMETLAKRKSAGVEWAEFVHAIKFSELSKQTLVKLIA